MAFHGYTLQDLVVLHCRRSQAQAELDTRNARYRLPNPGRLSAASRPSEEDDEGAAENRKLRERLERAERVVGKFVAQTIQPAVQRARSTPLKGWVGHPSKADAYRLHYLEYGILLKARVSTTTPLVKGWVGLPSEADASKLGHPKINCSFQAAQSSHTHTLPLPPHNSSGFSKGACFHDHQAVDHPGGQDPNNH